MKRAGYIIFLLGIIPSLFYSLPERPLWVMFYPFILISIVGALLTRFSGRRGREVLNGRDSADKFEDADILSYLENTLADVKNIAGKIVQGIHDREHIKRDIERIQEESLFFINRRDMIAERYGSSVRYDIFTLFARAERYLSRTWSALVDNHMDEAVRSIKISESELSGLIEFYRSIIDSRS